MTSPISFEIEHTDAHTGARAGILHTPHGDVPTPIFMPVGTQGTVKMLTAPQLQGAGARIILGNTYHLMLRPGAELIAELGGLHRFMAWPGPILTDSGGFQVFSLGDLNKITEDGVEFRSHIDGSLVRLTPESSMRIQEQLGADIAMAFDDCPPYPWEADRLRDAVERTIRWAARCREAHDRADQALFGIVQGGVDPQLRRRCADALADLDFDGYAVGGVSVGEGSDLLREGVDVSAPLLPREKPHYLMGVGPPDDMLHAIGAGIDMFDCVMPTRNARNACAFTFSGKLRMRNAQYARDDRPLEEGCVCEACRHYTRAAIRHWYIAGEATAAALVSIHNIHMFLELMRRAREAILADRFGEFRTEMSGGYER